jgi:ribosomal protein S18 acetylase RimI-like enzyme
MTSDNYKIVMIDFHYLNEAAELFDQYRQFYGQESNFHGAYNFLSELIKNKESVIYLAVDSKTQKVIGFMQLYPSFSSISMQRLWILNDLYVVPETRKQGIGKALIKTAQAWVKQKSDKGLSLATAVDNYSAQKLYHSLGFNRDEEFLHFFWK